jgi:subtilisin family serine protease
MRLMRNVWCVGFFVASACAVAACGGGGGSGSSPGGPLPGGPTPVPTATPTPSGHAYTLPPAGAVTASTYTVGSNPAGLAITLDGAAAGTTPATISPAYAATAHTITIAPGGAAAAFVVNVAQTANGSHTIFYNAQADTQGKIASVSPTSVRRRLDLMPRVLPQRLASSVAGRELYSARRLTVTYDATALAPQDTFAAVERRHGVSSAVTASQSDRAVVRVVTVGAARRLDEVATGLAVERGVRSVDRVRLRYPLASVFPNDKHFNVSEQWDLYEIAAPAGWGYGLGKPAIAIAVIDTGYDPLQPDVAPMVTFAEKVRSGFIDSSAGAATDTNGHGTTVSGIASALTNNAAGWAGVAFGATLQEYKVYPDGLDTFADSADVAEAIREAVAHNAKVILLALGGSAAAGPDALERDAVAFALSSGVTVVAASGDERATGATTINFPAGYDGVIAVGASAVNDTAFPGDALASPEYVASYSNAGPGLTLVAPGGDASSVADTDQVHWIENAYTTQPFPGVPACPAGTAPADCGARFTGTSMAAAHVAGAAALLLSQNAALTPAQLSTLLASTADDIADANQGAGRLNLRRAMAAVTGNPAVPQYLPAFRQFVAFAYTNLAMNATVPVIADLTYPRGVPVNADGTFRIADLPQPHGAYRIAVWYDTNGDGIIDAGDYFAVTAAPCPATGACVGAAALAVHPVAAGFVLP